MKTVHFMGIVGTEVLKVVTIAKEKGFSVSSCDSISGYATSHLDGINYLCVNPEHFDTHPRQEEMKEAVRRGIDVYTWQDFQRKFL